MRNTIEKKLSTLVRFKSLSEDHEENRALLGWYQRELSGLPMKVTRGEHGGFPYLLAYTRSERRPGVLLAAHVDVVGGPPALFEPKVTGRKFFGRGVFDMKYAAACYLALLQKLGSELQKFDLAVLLTTDEEIGGKNGTARVISKGLRPGVCVLPDSGDGFTFIAAAKGGLRLSVKSRGVSAHGSKPWRGSNAVDALMRFLVELEKKFPKEPCGKAEHWHDTLNVGAIRGGDEVNLVPDFAEAKLDIRLTPETSPVEIRRRVAAVAKKFPGISTEQLSAVEPYQIDVKHPAYKRFTELTKAKLGRPVTYGRSAGSCDARYFAAAGIPTIVLRPIGGGHHSDGEWVDLASCAQFTEVLEQFLREKAA